MKHKSLNQLLCAALVNNQFRDHLLTDPAAAIEAGFLGNRYHLTPNEYQFMVNIHANSLENMAEQVHSYIQADKLEPICEYERHYQGLNLREVLLSQISIESSSYPTHGIKLFEEVFRQ